jgi:predicted alpha/beta-fold hydrolase
LGCSKDIKEIIEKIKIDNENSKVVAVGTSMGGNQLLKYAGEQGKESKIEGIVALCAPFDIVICSRYLRKRSPIHSIPDQFLVENMLRVIKSNEDSLLHSYEELGINLDEVYKAERSFEFDSVFTCKLLGYKNPEHYYRKSSCVKYLHKVHTPTLAISSLDDPVVTSDCIPYEEFKGNPYLVLVETLRGGHIGWFTGLYPKRVKHK